MREGGLLHHFDDPLPLDEGQARRWLGAKGASLAVMTRMGLPVPPGFTLTTELWRRHRVDGALPPDLSQPLGEALERLTRSTGLRFGDPDAPLLLAVRSGAPSSMPGMLETVLDVGIQSDIARGLDRHFGVQGLGLDVRRRFLESYGTVVLGVPREAFDALRGGRDPRSFDRPVLEQLVLDYERLVRHETGAAVPDDPFQQLLTSIEGVLRSWHGTRAEQYRAAHRIDEDEGTAVTLQAMVYGNLAVRSGAGVAFSRNPSSGERMLYGEWLAQGQGEDVVSGRRTPSPLVRAQVRRGQEDESLETAMPEVLTALRQVTEGLESRFGDAQDVEFAVERGQLFVLQCRAAKRTARAAARIAVEMVEEGALTRTRALARVEPVSLRQLLTPRLPDPQSLADGGLVPAARGLAASPGAAVGRIVLDGGAAARMGPGEELILVRSETSAEDVETMRVVAGILTAAGGLTSHAAVVARAMGKPCVAGATSVHVDYTRRLVVTRSDHGTVELREGDIITIDGARGLVYAAAVPVEPASASPHVESILAWADELRTVEVLAEVSSPRLAQVGMSFGADGLLASGVTAETMRAAAGEGAVWLVVSPEAATGALQPGRDVVVLEPYDVGARALAAARGLAVGAVVRDEEPPEGLDAWVVDLPDPAAVARLARREIPSGVRLALRGEAAMGAAALQALSGRVTALVVGPLDVPVGRLCAARALE